MPIVIHIGAAHLTD